MAETQAMPMPDSDSDTDVDASNVERVEIGDITFTKRTPPERHPLFLGDNQIGRLNDDNTVQIMIEGKYVSNSHAIIVGQKLSSGELKMTIVDENSKSGTFLNAYKSRNKMEKGKPIPLVDGQKLYIADQEAVITFRPLPSEVKSDENPGTPEMVMSHDSDDSNGEITMNATAVDPSAAGDPSTAVAINNDARAGSPEASEEMNLDSDGDTDVEASGDIAGPASNNDDEAVPSSDQVGDEHTISQRLGAHVPIKRTSSSQGSVFGSQASVQLAMHEDVYDMETQVDVAPIADVKEDHDDDDDDDTDTLFARASSTSTPAGKDDVNAPSAPSVTNASGYEVNDQADDYGDDTQAFVPAARQGSVNNDEQDDDADTMETQAFIPTAAITAKSTKENADTSSDDVSMMETQAFIPAAATSTIPRITNMSDNFDNMETQAFITTSTPSKPTHSIDEDDVGTMETQAFITAVASSTHDGTDLDDTDKETQAEVSGVNMTNDESETQAETQAVISTSDQKTAVSGNVFARPFPKRKVVLKPGETSIDGIDDGPTQVVCAPSQTAVTFAPNVNDPDQSLTQRVGAGNTASSHVESEVTQAFVRDDISQTLPITTRDGDTSASSQTQPIARFEVTQAASLVNTTPTKETSSQAPTPTIDYDEELELSSDEEEGAANSPNEARRAELEIATPSADFAADSTTTSTGHDELNESFQSTNSDEPTQIVGDSNALAAVASDHSDDDTPPYAPQTAAVDDVETKPEKAESPDEQITEVQAPSSLASSSAAAPSTSNSVSLNDSARSPVPVQTVQSSPRKRRVLPGSLTDRDQNAKQPSDKASLRDLTVAQLKSELDGLGLVTSGRKADLIQRILDSKSANSTEDKTEEINTTGATEKPVVGISSVSESHEIEADTTNSGSNNATDCERKNEKVSEDEIDAPDQVNGPGFAADEAGEEDEPKINTLDQDGPDERDSPDETDSPEIEKHAVEDTSDSLQKFTVPQLRKRLGSMGMDTGGRKVDLIKRILSGNINSEGDHNELTEAVTTRDKKNPDKVSQRISKRRRGAEDKGEDIDDVANSDSEQVQQSRSSKRGRPNASDRSAVDVPSASKASLKRKAQRIIKNQESSDSNEEQKQESVVDSRPRKRGRTKVEASPPLQTTKGRGKIPCTNASEPISPHSRRTLTKQNQNVKLLLTGVADNDIKKLVKHLKGTIVDSVEECTHVYAEKIMRTIKFFRGVAQGKVFVGKKWLTECKNSSQFVDGSRFPLVDPSGEKKNKVVLADALERARQNKLFSGMAFAVHQGCKPEPPDLMDIITDCGGTVVALNRSTPKSAIVIVMETDKPEMYSSKGHRVCSPKIITDGALQQKINWGEHEFENEDMAGSASKANKRTKR